MRLKLFWRLASIFLIILLAVSGIILYIGVDSAQKNQLLVTQQLDRGLANACLDMVGDLLDDSTSEEAIKDIMHSMMVINPSVEVYLLDETGKILSYAAPKKVVKLENVDLEPIQDFINDYDGALILGDDPRNPGDEKIFSATCIKRNDKVTGYIYIILASQEYASVTDMLFGSYIWRLGTRTSVITVIFAGLIGLLAIFLITRQLRGILTTMNKFQEGNHASRVENTSGELGQIGTTFNSMAGTIQQQIEELKSVETLRKELIANISHDLRTPIASIQGFSELLETKAESLSPKESQEYLGIINKNVVRLKKLVQDLFDLSKLEAGAIKPQLEPLQTAELVSDIAAKYRVMANEKGIHLNTHAPTDLPVVQADVGMIDRALQNLVDNAIKHCEQGDTVNIELNKNADGSVGIRVSDTGHGIAEEDLPHIFERYFKGNATVSKTGTGLGLAITKRMLELHGSVIEVQSKLKEGTTFSFALPVIQPHQKPDFGAAIMSRFYYKNVRNGTFHSIISKSAD